MLKRAVGVVVSIDKVRNDIAELTIRLNNMTQKAIAYIFLTGNISVGDRVLLNTTAVKKKLGTGGFHYVMANLTNPQESSDTDFAGHIVKCRYTPVQHTVLSAEEDESPHRQAICDFTSLNGMSVIVGQLHSQLAPAAAAVKIKSNYNAKICYIMTDTAALPIGFSRSVTDLKQKGFVDLAITCGQAFGGDIEAVNIYTAMIVASSLCDVIIVTPGPGNVGTGTKYGFTSIEQGNIINAVNLLKGKPIAIPRISFADERERHYGISHHTITSLCEIVLTPCTIPIPKMKEESLSIVKQQISQFELDEKHEIVFTDGEAGIVELISKGILMQTMGRGYEEDCEFFLAASAAGMIAL